MFCRCLEIGGQEVLDAYLREQEQLVYCAMEQFDLDQLQQEIEEKQKVGDLDEVFQKYCRYEIDVWEKVRRAISFDKLSLTVNPGAFAATDSGFRIVWGNLCSQSVKVPRPEISCNRFSI